MIGVVVVNLSASRSCENDVVVARIPKDSVVGTVLLRTLVLFVEIHVVLKIMQNQKIVDVFVKVIRKDAYNAESPLVSMVKLLKLAPCALLNHRLEIHAVFSSS